MKIMREITPVKEGQPFVVLEHENAKFDYPLHFHPEYEINFITNFQGERTVGDFTEHCNRTDLVLLGPHLYHIWQSDRDPSHAKVVTIQFKEDFIGKKVFDYTMFESIKQLLQTSGRGIAFSSQTIHDVKDKINALCRTSGIESFLLFIDILKGLALDKEMRVLSNTSGTTNVNENKSRRISVVVDHIEKNYATDLRIGKLAEIVNMSESAFSHFFKKRT
ncbi:MAG: AraC family transcriptional regulator, partial [Bacteroidota bacterium]